MRKVLCLFLISLMLLGTLASCSGTTLEEGEKGAMIKMGVATLPDNFDPSTYAMDSDLAKIFNLVYATLTAINEDGETEGVIAEEWGYFYDDIYLEDKMYFDMKETGWSDGRALSADDFVYAWKRILAPQNKSPYAPLLYFIKNAKSVKHGDMTSDDLGLYAVDDTRIEITFEDGYINNNGESVANQVAETVASIAFAPLREDKVESNPAWGNEVKTSNILACGPFFLRSYSTGENGTSCEMQFERNKYYFRNDEEEEPLDEAVIPYRIICELNEGEANGEDVGVLEQLLADYNGGKVYYLSEFNPQTYTSVKTTAANSLASYVYYFNLNNKLFQKAEVRKALSMAIDRNEIARIMSCGAVASTGFVPEGVFGASEEKTFRSEGKNVYSASADVEGAKALLKSAGVKSGSFTISYIKNDENEANKLVAEYVAGVWSDLGFSVTTRGQNSTFAKSLMYGETADNVDPFDVIAVDLSMCSTNALAYLAPFACGFAGASVDINTAEDTTLADTHFTHYASEAYDELVAKAVGTSDRAQRNDLLHQIEALLAEECPAFAVVSYKNCYTASSKISDYEHNYNGLPNFNRVELEDWRSVNSAIEEAEKAATEVAA